MSESEQFIIFPEPSPEATAAAIICGHKVIQDLGIDGMCDFQAFVQEVLATTVPPAKWATPDGVVIPHAQHEALMAARDALEQCVDDFGETGQCVCQRTKEQAIAAIAACHVAGISEDGP